MQKANTEKNIKEKSIMIGCPEDVENKFLGKIKEAVQEFNDKQGKEFGIQLTARHWRDGTHSSAENVQESINRQLCDVCDYLLAVFYCSSGSAVASEEEGTFTEIQYFNKHGKQVFVHKYAGEVSVNLSNKREWDILQNDLNKLEKGLKDYAFKDYADEEGLKRGIIEDLTIFFNKLSKSRKGNSAKKSGKRKSSNPIQDAMREYTRLCDNWIAIKTKNLKFSFYEKAKDLIAGMQEDGSVQYYVGSQERFRTTPTASTLEALYLAKLLPDMVRYTMQDWVYNSRQDPCDDPGKEGKSEGHEPDDKDTAGWSWNEGVSVWATSKALGTLITTGYYERPDIREDQEIMQTTYAALSWLAKQEYPDGGWGFQFAKDKKACEPSVTMTALALKVITKFLMDSSRNDKPFNFGQTLEKELSAAKRKGIAYLVDTMQEDEQGHIYWEYDGKPSLTGTVWVLDFINMAQRREARELYNKREKIVSFCVSKLPASDGEFEDFSEEVYFVGGETKYKHIEEYSKFYSYMPYHIPVILQSGIKLSDEDDKRIKVCIRALTKGKEEFWNGMDNSDGYFQHPTCFVRAMALSVVAFWMRKTWGELIDNKLGGDWGTEEYDNEESR